MEEILLKAKEKVMREQFLIDVKTPSKLKDYFLANFITPLEEIVSSVNTDFFEMGNGNDVNETGVRFLSNKLVIVVHPDRVIFKISKEFSYDYQIKLQVSFNSEKPKVYENNSLVLLENSHLKSIVEDFISEG